IGWSFTGSRRWGPLLETESSAIFDRILALFESKVLHPAVPNLKRWSSKLSVWKMFEPMHDPVSQMYEDLYWSLCKNTHVTPDMTMMGRLMVVSKVGSSSFVPSVRAASSGFCGAWQRSERSRC